MSSLRLGPIQEGQPVRLTLRINPALCRDLQDYARVHAQIHGNEASLAALIPAICARFIASDRAFAKARRALPPQGQPTPTAAVGPTHPSPNPGKKGD